MNIYKNLMFLHGHFVDPRDADEDGDDGAQIGRRAASTAASAAASKAAVGGAKAGTSAATASHRVQAARTEVIAGWREWLRLWPSETAKVELDCDARGCA
ncbi:hypothetical protein AZ78_3037 [Lysobacter capsici AZ78]|uniref:Uncharacterized protein n=1 Tax=Lysobacter capsici AZ78 TaxID=1444315 RepID=A0A108UAD9_9GAMM|nr:hypothetical protein [Lysobacter capsici]KWS05485.1 hypothetical protein AZ78_3037 [Lysobacter capsici AZ78]